MSSNHVRADGLRAYLTAFHDQLLALADRYLPLEARQNPPHAALLHSQVLGYVSTQFGVAWEYIPFDATTGYSTTTYDIRLGSARVEDLILVEAPKAMLKAKPVVLIEQDRIWFTGINLQGRFVLTREEAHVVFDRCAFTWPLGVGRQWFKGTAILEVYGDRRAEMWTPDRGVMRAQQEVLTALFELNRAAQRGLSLLDYAKQYREKVVLLLGSYSAAGRARLGQVKAILTGLGYDPILLSDIADQPGQTLSQKVVMLGSLSRFIVMDDTERSGALAELPLCKDNGWLTAVLRPMGRASSAMSANPGLLSSVILEVDFHPDDLQLELAKVAVWAERRHQELSAALRPEVPPPGFR